MQQAIIHNTIAGNTSCQPIELFIPPFNTDVGIEAILHVSGIDNLSPLWDTWVWQDADIYGVGLAPNPNPTWVNKQTGGLSYTVDGDDRMVRVVLTNGSCIYWSNESGYVEDLSCPIRLEAFSLDGTDVFPIITGPNSLEDVVDPSKVSYNPNAFTFQMMGGTGPAFTWTDVQTGEYAGYDKLKYVGVGDNVIRIKYTHTDGCVYYSGVVYTYFT